MGYSYQWQDERLSINPLDKSAHSSKPEYGVNAINNLAGLLAVNHWPNNTSGALVNFLNDHLGLIAYSDDFMGPMSVEPTER